MARSGADRWGEFTVDSQLGDWSVASCDDPPVEVSVRIEQIEGKPEVVGLRIGHTGQVFERLTAPLILTAALIHTLPVGRLKAAALAHGPGFYAVPVGTPGKGPVPLPDSRFQEVADIYKRADAAGSPPLAAIATAYGLSRPGARRYVRLARERGFLAWPTRKGVAGASAAESPYAGDRWARERRTKAPRTAIGQVGADQVSRFEQQVQEAALPAAPGVCRRDDIGAPWDFGTPTAAKGVAARLRRRHPEWLYVKQRGSYVVAKAKRR
jgi:hypothetical protein